MGQVIAFLDKHYPNSAPGSPDPDQAYDDNKKESRVILKGGAWRRVDSALGGKDEKGVVDRELARSYRLLLDLFEAAPGAYRLAVRFVLLNVNTAGGYEELERIERVGRNGDRAAKTVAKMCRKVIRDVLDELDERGYWLGWGTDAEDAERKAAAADRRRRQGILADESTAAEIIAAYRDLMERSGNGAEEAKRLTADHFGCSVSKVEKATSEGAA